MWEGFSYISWCSVFEWTTGRTPTGKKRRTGAAVAEAVPGAASC